MAYQIDPTNGDIIIGGFEQGIGDSPYTGLTDAKSVNLSGVPGEASVNFSMQGVNQVPQYTNGTFTTDINGNLNLTVANGNFLENGQAITVSASTISGLTAGTAPLWVYGASKQSGVLEWLQVVSVYGGSSALTLGTTGTATFSTVNMATPKFFANASQGGSFGSGKGNFMIDSAGKVWSDYVLTAGGVSIPSTSSWTYTGNTTFSDSKGNGLVYWRTARSNLAGDWDGWLLLFRDGAIDYCNINGVSGGTAYHNEGTYVYGWNPATATTGQSAYLSGNRVSACPHNAIVGPDGRVYFCDYYNIRKIYQTDLVTPKTFSPTDNTSFTQLTFNLLPINDISTCLSPLGTDMLIGGIYNQAYRWNTTSNLITNPILLAESYVSSIITVNTNAYIFCGNRGNIYVTNGSQANVYKKVPDHISGTPEPYFIWGGTTFNKNRLYFSVYVMNNAGTAISGYGGIWVIDIPTGAMWLSNQLSYGTYAGYATALASIPPVPYYPITTPQVSEPAGIGLLAGWSNTAAGTFGVDQSISTPYTGGQSYIISDLIPIGTLLKPTTPAQVEFKLATPLLAGETVELQVATDLSSSFTSAVIVSGDGSLVSGNSTSFPIQEIQWLQIKAILTGISSNPSYNRLTQLRVVGATQQIGSFSGI